MKHLLAHNKDHFVKIGDKVEKYKTKVASIGKGSNNEYWAHLHISSYEGLTDSEVKKYVNGWTKKKVQDYYQEPAKLIDFSKMFSVSMNTTAGWGWLENYGKGYHPGNDVNADTGGDSDLGLEYTAPCDGVVVFEGDWGKGWGKVLIIEEAPTDDCVPSGALTTEEREFAERKEYKTYANAVRGAMSYRADRENYKETLEEYKKTAEEVADRLQLENKQLAETNARLLENNKELIEKLSNYFNYYNQKRFNNRLELELKWAYDELSKNQLKNLITQARKRLGLWEAFITLWED